MGGRYKNARTNECNERDNYTKTYLYKRVYEKRWIYIHIYSVLVVIIVMIKAVLEKNNRQKCLMR